MDGRVIREKKNITKLKKCHQQNSLIFCSGHMVTKAFSTSFFFFFSNFVLFPCTSKPLSLSGFFTAGGKTT